MLYAFEILLVSEKEDVDLTSVLQNPATFTIKGAFSGGEDLPFHGILSVFEQKHQADNSYFYRAELRPRLWWLTLTHHNQVFLNKKSREFLTEVLEDGGLFQGMDFEFRYQGPYPIRDFICQYGESHYDFLSRWMERAGCYYWFEQDGQSEKMIAADSLIAHTPLSGHETFRYSPPSGLDATEADRVIKDFSLRQYPLPKNVLVKDYNYMKPGLELVGKSRIQDKGRGEIYTYNDNALSRREAEGLAKIRAEEYRCGEKIYHGLSSIPAIRSGYLFSLEKHFRNDFNQPYLTTRVRHEGSQQRYLLGGLGSGDQDDPEALFYRNTFECIPATTQFRPPRTTPRPRISGTVTAHIDAAGSGQYAELDKYGRYKVILPFDLSGRKGGKASAWLRMMQPYAGEGMGFHAPLHKGTEVLLAFIDGDPDRPVIAGAVPNADTPSPVTETNQTQVRLVSGGGNVLHMEDEKGRERILLHSPTAGSFIRIGYRNDPDGHEPPEEDKTKEVEDPQGDCMHDNTEGIVVHSEKTLTLESGAMCTIVHGDEFIRVNGDERYIIEGSTEEFVLGAESTFVGGNVFEGVGGNVFEAVVGASEEAFLGLKTELKCSGVFELEGPIKGEFGYGWKWSFHEMKEKFIAEENTLEGIKHHLSGEIKNLVVEHEKLVGSVHEMATETSKLALEAQSMNSSVMKLQCVATVISGDVDETTAKYLSAIGEETEVRGSKILSCGGKIQTVAEDTKLAGVVEII